MRKILFVLLTSLTLFACKKDDTLMYGNMTMGNIDGETIISDQGNTFDIVEGYSDLDLSKFEYGRVMIMCDVLTKTADKRYDIRLNGISSVLTKETEKASSITDSESEMNVDNPINIREIWYSGGYINMLVELARKNGSDTKHLINLIHDDSAVKEGEYTFILRHNAFGETPTEQNTNFVASYGYVSFPVTSVIKEDSAKIIMKWKSHKMINGGYSLTQSEDCTKEYDWKNMGYIHDRLVPTTPNLTLCRNFLAR